MFCHWPPQRAEPPAAGPHGRRARGRHVARAIGSMARHMPPAPWPPAPARSRPRARRLPDWLQPAARRVWVSGTEPLVFSSSCSLNVIFPVIFDAVVGPVHRRRASLRQVLARRRASEHRCIECILIACIWLRGVAPSDQRASPAVAVAATKKMKKNKREGTNTDIDDEEEEKKNNNEINDIDDDDDDDDDEDKDEDGKKKKEEEEW